MNKFIRCLPRVEEGIKSLVQFFALRIIMGLGVEVTEHSDVVLDVVGLTCSDSPEQTFAGFQIYSQEVS